ncbi:hypothetical protein ACMXY9_02355 [Pasteurella multocida]|uniref:hypothetical protein n=1 Tax=Pasteurella multocida TaxID=747 RepID=UPI003CFB38C5
MYESQAKKLFIKKSDIENALDISLDGIPTKKFSFMENKSNQLAALEDYLKPYALMDRFTLDESIALLLGEYPDNPNSDIKYHYLYDSIRKLLKREIENGNLNNLGGITETSIDISHSELEQWAKRNSYKWILPPYNLLTTNQNQEQKDLNTQEKDWQIAELQNRIAELEKENFKLTETRAVENNIGSTSRISTPQRAVFSLLVMKCYSDCSTRNELFSVINAELKEKGIINKDIQYTTLDKLIDEGLRINNLSPFPSKIK